MQNKINALSKTNTSKPIESGDSFHHSKKISKFFGSEFDKREICCDMDPGHPGTPHTHTPKYDYI